jgi:hypothetical protein
MPGAVDSDAFHYMAQGIRTVHGRHQNEWWKASERCMEGIRTSDGRHQDKLTKIIYKFAENFD